MIRRAATETAAAKLARLQEQIRQAKEQEGKALSRRAEVVGDAIIDEMQDKPEFKTLIGEILKRRIGKPKDRAEIASLLIDHKVRP